jgi:hypothetical protein
MRNRSLSLKREILAELTPAEMAAINGGTHVGCGTTGAITHVTFDACPTLPLNCVTAITSTCATK